MKKHILSAVLLLIAAFLVAVCVAEISFPESVLTFTDYESLIAKFPKIWKYNIHTGLAALVIAVLLIIPAYKKDKEFALKGLETLLRLGIGGMFIFASIFKIQDPHGFAVLVAQYQFLPSFANNLFSLIYPQFEFWFGLAIIVTPFIRESAFVIFWMFISFIIALSWALALDLGITCGCFELEGAQSKSEAWTSLIRDIILIGPTFWLALRPNRSILGIWKK
ncbi:MAG: hypothetical protein M0P13_10135 [Fibrobacteraceae bacterium]|nr:hypothetical protein [Fibrobacteraceae bacterium]